MATLTSAGISIWTIAAPLITVGSICPRCPISPRALLGEAPAARAGLQGGVAVET